MENTLNKRKKEHGDVEILIPIKTASIKINTPYNTSIYEYGCTYVLNIEYIVPCFGDWDRHTADAFCEKNTMVFFENIFNRFYRHIHLLDVYVRFIDVSMNKKNAIFQVIFYYNDIKINCKNLIDIIHRNLVISENNIWYFIKKLKHLPTRNINVLNVRVLNSLPKEFCIKPPNYYLYCYYQAIIRNDIIKYKNISCDTTIIGTN